MNDLSSGIVTDNIIARLRKQNARSDDRIAALEAHILSTMTQHTDPDHIPTSADVAARSALRGDTRALNAAVRAYVQFADSTDQVELLMRTKAAEALLMRADSLIRSAGLSGLDDLATLIVNREDTAYHLSIDPEVNEEDRREILEMDRRRRGLDVFEAWDKFEAREILAPLRAKSRDD